MKDYRVLLKVKNNRILEAIENSGFDNVNKFCDYFNIAPSNIYDYINLKSSPLNAEGNLYKSAQLLCDALGLLPEDLWSKEQVRPLEKNFAELKMSYDEILKTLPFEQTSYEFIDSVEIKQKIDGIKNALSELTDREKKVIDLIYYQDKNLTEISKIFNLSFQRIQQIEGKALRKLRHPARQKLYIETV